MLCYVMVRMHTCMHIHIYVHANMFMMCIFCITINSSCTQKKYALGSSHSGTTLDIRISATGCSESQNDVPVGSGVLQGHPIGTSLLSSYMIYKMGIFL